MWLPKALMLLCVPGSLSLRGPSTVMGTVGGSLSVQCQYQEEYKTFTKYWCRQPCLPLFSETVKTSASGGEVRRGRVSITDHPGNLTFTVALENLTANDAGKYRCGISTMLVEDGLPGFLPEPFFQVQVLVSPGPSAPESGGSSSELVTDPGRMLQASARGSTVRTMQVTGADLGGKSHGQDTGACCSPSPSTTASSSKSSSRTPVHSSQGPGSLLSSVHFLLLIFLKVPLFLGMLSAILWVNRPQRAIRGPTQSGEDKL